MWLLWSGMSLLIQPVKCLHWVKVIESISLSSIFFFALLLQRANKMVSIFCRDTFQLCWLIHVAFTDGGLGVSYLCAWVLSQNEEESHGFPYSCMHHTVVRKLWFRSMIEKDIYKSTSPTLCPRWDQLHVSVIANRCLPSLFLNTSCNRDSTCRIMQYFRSFP